MSSDEAYISKARALIESRTGWGNSDQWTNQDFLALSEKIREQTGVTLSHVTLKRIWGKVRYDSLPNPHTLDTLARFAGYEHWRDFKLSAAVSPLTAGSPGSLQSSRSPGSPPPPAPSTPICCPADPP